MTTITWLLTCKQRARGAAIIEFALVLPLLMGILFAFIELGIALYDKAVVTNAAREGARYAVLRRADTVTDAQRASYATDRALSYAKRELISLSGEEIEDHVAVVVTPESVAPGQAGTKVRVTYEYTGLLLDPIFRVTLQRPLLLVAEVVMRNE